MESTTTQLQQQMKTLGDPTRMRLVALCHQGECSVSELTGVIGQSQPRISQHLKQLCAVGILQRFRDGKHVFYKVPAADRVPAVLRRLLELIPADDAEFLADRKLLRHGRGQRVDQAATDPKDESADRALHRAILDLTVTAPIGDLLDIGCGRGAILKLLASRANRAVGVDIDSDARQLARAELMLAGIPNCSLRKGDMYRLPFNDEQFNTIIIDDVLTDARDPVGALEEGMRVLRPGGRLIVLESVLKKPADDIQHALAHWCRNSGLRLAPARLVPKTNPVWLVSVAMLVSERHVAA